MAACLAAVRLDAALPLLSPLLGPDKGPSPERSRRARRLTVGTRCLCARRAAPAPEFAVALVAPASCRRFCFAPKAGNLSGNLAPPPPAKKAPARSAASQRAVRHNKT